MVLKESYWSVDFNGMSVTWPGAFPRVYPRTGAADQGGLGGRTPLELEIYRVIANLLIEMQNGCSKIGV